MLLSTISFIYYFILFRRPQSPTPESTLFVVQETLEGLKHNTGFEGRGCFYTGGGDRFVHCSKRGHFIEVSQHFCPSLWATAISKAWCDSNSLFFSSTIKKKTKGGSARRVTVFLVGMRYKPIYSQTSLIRTPKGQNQVSALQRCPYYRGRECMIFGFSGTKRTVRDREVSVL